MPHEKHSVIVDENGIGRIKCPATGRSRVFNTSTQSVVLVCPVCNKAILEITPAGRNGWTITENAQDVYSG